MSRCTPTKAISSPGTTKTCSAKKRESVAPARSEEHTSELQSRQYLVCRLLLEKKNKQNRRPGTPQQVPTSRNCDADLPAAPSRRARATAALRQARSAGQAPRHPTRQTLAVSGA